MKEKKRGAAGGKAIVKRRGKEWMRKLGRRSAAKRRKALKLLEQQSVK